MSGGQAQTNVEITAPGSDHARQWDGWGTALKPAFEPIVVARKPLIGNVATNVLEWGVGGLNIDASRIAFGDETDARVGTDFVSNGGDASNNANDNQVPNKHYVQMYKSNGRWPANIILDEFTADLVDQQSGLLKSPATTNRTENKSNGWGFSEVADAVAYGDSGGASRFFYVAKASKRDRNDGLDYQDNTHPTIKPTTLMEYLIKLVTPPKGVVLDPFAGSGSTGKAALLNGFSFIGIELTPEYIPIIEQRLKHAMRQANLNIQETLF
jgi:site-specific DNA-methyltransferase (adenine-specific)